MISSTSITSTMGVTLMSDTGGAAFFLSIEFLQTDPRRELPVPRRARPGAPDYGAWLGRASLPTTPCQLAET
jgi:hypothetical protein